MCGEEGNRTPETGISGGRRGNHPWAVAGILAGRRAIRCISNRTRPLSWLGSASFGTHPRTKGARCFAGGHRRRTPSTRKVSARLHYEARGNPSERRRMRGSINRMMRSAEENAFLSPGNTITGELHAVSEGGDMLGMPRGDARLCRRPLEARPQADVSCFTSFLASIAAFEARIDWNGLFCGWSLRWPACPCSRDSGCSSRTGRSCRCAGG